MNGYLMQQGTWTPGEDLFLESHSPENSFGVVFEDDGETAYFYAVEKDKEGAGLQILDALHIHDNERQGVVGGETNAGSSKLQIVWSRDWMKCALVIDGFCHAVFDFEAHGGYNLDEFPPPNEIWTRSDRKLTDELMRRLF